MACRKAAYNALTEMSEFMEKQAEYAAAAKTRLETEQRKIWTPTEILEVCCIPWLSDGSEVVGHRTNHHVSKGCSGGCGKNHPRITLQFDNVNGSSAVLSHSLDPFVQYFEELCSQGLASRVNPEQVDESSGDSNGDSPVFHPKRIYRLVGFLNDHGERLRQCSRFGYHLVKVSPVAMAASRRAHDRHVEQTEELERHKKRKRIETAVGSTTHERNLFETAMQICYDQGALSNNLDVLDVSWMRLTGDRMLSKLAAKVATTRLRRLRLTYTAALLGTCSDDGGVTRNCFDSENFINIRCGPYPLQNSYDNPGLFVPITDDQWITWENDGDDDCAPRSLASLFLRISIRLEGTDPLSMVSSNGPPEMDCLFQQPIEVGWYHIELLKRYSGSGAIPEGQLSVSSEQTPCSKLTVQVPSRGLEYRQGSLSVFSLNFEFHHLLGIYARKKLPLAKQRMMEIKKHRPVTRAEKDYVRAIAKAARQAPGTGERTFVGLDGWPGPSSRGLPSFTRYDNLRVNAASSIQR
ncbi:hypothetical protein IV203_026136 [Nitzschia inconspicua]|uniref:Uncharacterized protein n=1 Tax=Nitzschia inconspicua TaxID=303405 RepID=A0A9K3LLR9_9STRA|nr:hypothetical protein IV203_026136 [Nitzschia inconspicua]